VGFAVGYKVAKEIGHDSAVGWELAVGFAVGYKAAEGMHRPKVQQLQISARAKVNLVSIRSELKISGGVW
jgi:hypothetical protein